jgi:methionyl aminopeptidase
MAILKSPEDLENLKHSCLILMSCFAKLEPMLKPGISAGELNKVALEYIRSKGGEPSFLGHQGYKYALCVSVNDEVVHGIPDPEKIIPDNSIVSLDMGVIYKGMFSDAAKTYVVGEVPDKIKELVEVTNTACWAGIKILKSGARVGDIGAAVNAEAKKHGFGNVVELGGHGVGYAVWEEPFISHVGTQGKGARLFENQAICIEPMFTLGNNQVVFDQTIKDGWTVRTKDHSWAAHSEHTILVTKKGFEVLTDIAKEKLLD